MRKRILYFILAAFAVGTFVLVYMQHSAAKSINHLLEGDAKLLNEFTIRKNLHTIEKNIVLLQHSVKAMYLEKNSAAVTKANDQIKEIYAAEDLLKKLVDDKHASLYVDSLDTAVSQKINLCLQVISAYHQQGPATAESIVNTNSKVWISNDVEHSLKRIDSSRNAYLTSITEAFDKSGRRALLLNYALTILLLLACAILCIYIIYIIQKIIKSEKRIIEVSKVKENFMANMSHEIRTPLNAIMGFTALLERSNLDKQSQEYVKTIQDSGENLLTIINEILDLSKIEAGMMRIESAPFSIRSLLDSVRVMFDSKATEKKLILQTKVDESIPDILTGDATRLTQILVNLIGNAMKFTERGNITVHISNEGRDAKTIRTGITVSDTGIGIPKDKQKAIFNRFQQADDSVTRNFGGTGLGLSIVNELITLQHGTIKVESEPGKGTAFILMIPYIIAENQEEAKGTPTETAEYAMHPHFNNKRLLVAEDNEINQSLIRYLFRDWQLDYDLAQNGKEAVAMISRNKYDLVLMDIQMPEMDGYTATQEIRNTLKINTPIIAMTAHALAGEKEKCLSYGMNEYISKPIREAQLYTLIAAFTNIRPENRSRAAYQYDPSHYTYINLDYMKEISGGNQDYEKTVTALFIEAIPQNLAAIETAWQNKDITQLRRQAHTMKTNISVMGLTDKLLPCLDELENSDLTPETFALQFYLLKKICEGALDEAGEFYRGFSS